MALPSWLCINSTKNMLVKIVHPAGHVELHDRPLLAAEIMLRNPRCYVTYSHVFQQPWAIVAPNTMLMLGQKFYVVPIKTIRKLQLYRFSSKHSSSPIQEVRMSQNDKDEEDDGLVSTCWLFVNKNTPKLPYTCLKPSDDRYKSHTGSACRSTKEKEEFHNCFMSLLTGIKLKADGDDSSDYANSNSTVGCSETKELHRKRTKDHASKVVKGSLKKHSSFDHWQPRLESISEEE